MSSSSIQSNGLHANAVLSCIDCGLTHITDEEIKTKLKERAPEKAHDIEGMKFGEITE